MISVCIPTFEQYGFGVHYLTQLLNSIVPQKGTFEVIISDNSKDDSIKTLCALYQDRLPLKYFHNPIIGISANTNNAIEKASYSKIKIMYMDDLLMDNYALAHFSEALNKSEWVTSNSYRLDGNGKHGLIKRPTYTPGIIQGYNTIGMPSVVGFRKNSFRFDENLKTLLDCEFYYFMHKNYGFPALIEKPIVGQRYHVNSTSSKQGNLRVTEFEYLKTKYPELRKITLK